MSQFPGGSSEEVGKAHVSVNADTSGLKEGLNEAKKETEQATQQMAGGFRRVDQAADRTSRSIRGLIGGLNRLRSVWMAMLGVIGFVLSAINLLIVAFRRLKERSEEAAEASRKYAEASEQASRVNIEGARTLDELNARRYEAIRQLNEMLIGLRKVEDQTRSVTDIEKELAEARQAAIRFAEVNQGVTQIPERENRRIRALESELRAVQAIINRKQDIEQEFERQRVRIAEEGARERERIEAEAARRAAQERGRFLDTLRQLELEAARSTMDDRARVVSEGEERIRQILERFDSGLIGEDELRRAIEAIRRITSERIRGIEETAEEQRRLDEDRAERLRQQDEERRQRLIQTERDAIRARFEGLDIAAGGTEELNQILFEVQNISRRAAVQTSATGPTI